MTRPGRNDLCPCGSGKKYKRCCLGKESRREELSRELTAHALPLLRELGNNAAQRAGSAIEAVAAERFPFWRPPLDKIRASRLLDFLIFDHRVAKYGRTAIEEYLAERGTIIPLRWRELLETWQRASMRLFEFEQWSGGLARCRALLPDDGGSLEVVFLEHSDVPIAQGAPVALRPLTVGAGFFYPSWPITFGSRSAGDVAAAITARHHAFVRSERIVSLEEFLRLNGTVFDEEAAGPLPAAIIVPGRP